LGVRCRVSGLGPNKRQEQKTALKSLSAGLKLINYQTIFKSIIAEICPKRKELTEGDNDDEN